MAARAWPAVLLPSAVDFNQDIADRSGGVSLTGDEQIVQTSAGRWKASLTFTVSRRAGADSAARLLAARGIKAYMQGRGNAVLIGPYDNGNAPARLLGLGSTSATAGAAAALGASVLRVTMGSSAYVPRAGQYFGLAGARLHMIQDGGVALVASNSYNLTIWPPLRAAVSNGAAVDFETPVCQMRQAAADSFGLSLGAGYVGSGSIDLVEDFRP